MFIYNVTVNISNDVHDEWLNWMKKVHIPDVLNTGCFVENQIVKVLKVEDEGTTYSLQYKFTDMDILEKYQTQFAPKLQAEHNSKYKDKFVAFRTILEIIE
ncbi:MAG: DUF4286 family protein [Bacteroidia bacterium]